MFAFLPSGFPCRSSVISAHVFAFDKSVHACMKENSKGLEGTCIKILLCYELLRANLARFLTWC